MTTDTERWDRLRLFFIGGLEGWYAGEGEEPVPLRKFLEAKPFTSMYAAVVEMHRLREAGDKRWWYCESKQEGRDF